MDIKTAIASKIEPYSVSDEALETAYKDASYRFGTDGGVEDEYVPALHLKTATLSAMMVLSNLKTLTSENIGGLSNSYDTGKIDALIRNLAKMAGLSPALVGLSDLASIPCVRAVKVW